MIESFYIAAVFIGLLLVIENWSLQENQGKFKGASVLISSLEFIWFLINLYILFFSGWPFIYLIIPIMFILYNMIGWIASFRYIDLPAFDDLETFDDFEDDKKALKAMEKKMKEDMESFKNTQIPKPMLDVMLYFTVLYTVANIYVVVKIWWP